MREKTSPRFARTFLPCSNGKHKLRDALKPTGARMSFQKNDKKFDITNIMVNNFEQVVSFTCNVILFHNIYCSTVTEILKLIRFFNDIICI